jgi:hypothetical protein
VDFSARPFPHFILRAGLEVETGVGCVSDLYHGKPVDSMPFLDDNLFEPVPEAFRVLVESEQKKP